MPTSVWCVVWQYAGDNNNAETPEVTVHWTLAGAKADAKEQIEAYPTDFDENGPVTAEDYATVDNWDGVEPKVLDVCMSNSDLWIFNVEIQD